MYFLQISFVWQVSDVGMCVYVGLCLLFCECVAEGLHDDRLFLSHDFILTIYS